MKNEYLKHQMGELSGGCSALSWSTEDGLHFWGRNFDFSRLAQGTGVTFVPRGTQYYTCGTSMENNLDENSRCTAAYAAAGTGFTLLPSTPVLYEGINEKGLMGGQLYYRGFAQYANRAKHGLQPLQPPFVVYHLLAQCASVDEAVSMLTDRFFLADVPMLGTVPPLHWSFSDRTGETIVVEPDRQGLSIYRQTIGVMTNSPGYDWHRLNLLNYAGIRDLDYSNVEIDGDRQEQCFSGSGAQGLPGDWSSPSRFIRLAMLKQYAAKARGEQEGVSRMLRLFESAAFPLGMVRVSEQGHITEYDKDVSPYDYTVYTSVMCSETLRFYWTTYENSRVQYIDLSQLMRRGKPFQVDMGRLPDFKNAAQ